MTRSILSCTIIVGLVVVTAATTTTTCVDLKQDCASAVSSFGCDRQEDFFSLGGSIAVQRRTDINGDGKKGPLSDIRCASCAATTPAPVETAEQTEDSWSETTDDPVADIELKASSAHLFGGHTPDGCSWWEYYKSNEECAETAVRRDNSDCKALIY